jgi:hypothetical protein
MNIIGILLLAVILMLGVFVSAFTKRRPVRFAGLAVGILVVAAVGFFLRQSNRWNYGFFHIHSGDSREIVRKVMGIPTEATDETIGIYGSQRRLSDRIPGCTEQYWYYPFFTPECWWIAFDAQGHVLKMYHYISP